MRWKRKWVDNYKFMISLLENGEISQYICFWDCSYFISATGDFEQYSFEFFLWDFFFL